MSFSAEFSFSKIFLYIDSSIKTIEQKNLKNFLEERTGVEVHIKKDFLKAKNEEDLEKKIAKTKVRNKRKKEFKEPLLKEVEIEKKIIQGDKDLLGIIYGRHQLVKLLQKLLDQKEKKDHTIIITKRLIGTLEKNESRYHIRTVINTIPSVISVSGIVEGPAKPRRYYFTDDNEKENVLDFDPMQHSDERIESAVRSYILQTVFWRLEGYPFCDKEGCCLNNSHWQKDVIKNQVNGELCKEHEEILEKFKKESSV
ncbi:MAG: DUF6775 family putative metallopeptidase [Candidatus Natronoplasma sp.]